MNNHPALHYYFFFTNFFSTFFINKLDKNLCCFFCLLVRKLLYGGQRWFIQVAGPWKIGIAHKENIFIDFKSLAAGILYRIQRHIIIKSNNGSWPLFQIQQLLHRLQGGFLIQICLYYIRTVFRKFIFLQPFKKAIESFLGGKHRIRALDKSNILIPPAYQPIHYLNG